MSTYDDTYVRYKIKNPQDYTPVEMADALEEVLTELQNAECRIDDLENELTEVSSKE